MDLGRRSRSRSLTRHALVAGPCDDDRLLRILIYSEFILQPIGVEVLQQLHCYDPLRSRTRFISIPREVISNGTLCDWTLSDEEFRNNNVFCLQDKAKYDDSLSMINPTPRDHRITFTEVTHVYDVDGIVVPWSGTTFSQYCKIHFDADAVLAKSTPGLGFRTKYLRADGQEMSVEEIKVCWEQNGMSQSRRGTLLHWHIECYFNGYIIAEPHSPEFLMFLQFERYFLDSLGLTPWRVEMNMFHCGLRLAGQADLICLDHSGALVILDWKRSKEIRVQGFQDQMQLPPLSHLPNSNLYSYYLQLNTYRFILEHEYGFHVSGMYFVVLHPKQVPQIPHIYQVPKLEDEIIALVKLVAAEKGVSTEDFASFDSPFDLTGVRFGHVSKT
jgi:hypothetical protein